MGILKRIAPIFAVRNVRISLKYYGRLGFITREYQHGGYGFVTRDGIEPTSDFLKTLSGGSTRAFSSTPTAT